MNALRKYHKHNGNNDLKKLKYGTTFKNYVPKYKYIFNELYRTKAIPREELVFIVKRIINHKGKFGLSKSDETLKNLAEGFVSDHDELFQGDWRKDEETDDEYEDNKPILTTENKNILPIENKEEMPEQNTQQNVSENTQENASKNVSENHVQNVGQNAIEKLDEIKEDVKQIEQLKEHPDKRHIEEFNTRLGELRTDIEKKFNDMIDSHLDLKKSIEEKRNINDHDAKSRIENMEGKIEMLYGKQMEEQTKPKKNKVYKPEKKSKEDIMREYIGKSFIVR